MVSFNPIGYESTTINGTKYKKSNIAKSVSIAAAIGIGVATRKKKPLKTFGKTADEIIADFLKECGKDIKFSDKTKKIIQDVDKYLDLLALVVIGIFVDKYINKKRAEKADAYVC